MKKYITILFSLICAVSSLSAQTDFLGLSSMSLGGQEYQLKWSAKSKDGRYLQEYLKKGESYPKFETKVVVEYIFIDKSLEDEVTSIIGRLALKKEQSIVYAFQQLEATRSGEVVIEYLQGNVQGGQPFTLEWNVHRYCVVDGKVVLLRVLHRVYNTELKMFQTIVDQKREGWISEVNSFDLSKIQVNK